MSAQEASVVRYVLDAGASTFTVQAFASGLLGGFGHDPVIAIREFTGEVRFVPGTIADASLRLVALARSLEVTGDVKEDDRQTIERTMLDEALEAAKYPEIVFQSTSATPMRIAGARSTVRIVGDASLHGVTRNGIWILARLTVNGDTLRAEGDFTLKQTDFGIKLVSVAGGALKVKDELRFAFDLVGKEAPGSG